MKEQSSILEGLSLGYSAKETCEVAASQAWTNIMNSQLSSFNPTHDLNTQTDTTPNMCSTDASPENNTGQSWNATRINEFPVFQQIAEVENSTPSSSDRFPANSNTEMEIPQAWNIAGQQLPTGQEEQETGNVPNENKESATTQPLTEAK